MSSIRKFAGGVKRAILGNRSTEIAQETQATPVQADWSNPFDTLRDKWREVPYTAEGRAFSKDLMNLSDGELLKGWQASDTLQSAWNVRGWYHELYKDSLRGKKILDIGCGLAFDTIFFAQHGAEVTFVDLAQSNLDVVKRICDQLGVKANGFHQLVDVDSLKLLDNDFDAILAMGSLHNAPVEVMKPEYVELANHLKIGGRWLQLAYPKSRWELEGCKPFNVWGQTVDGERTPWIEWYDTEKLLSMLHPATFDIVFYYEWSNCDYNWFDLKRIS